MDFLIILLFGLALIYMLVVLPQRRRQTAHRRMVERIEVGDEIITSGGIYAYVRGIGGEDLEVEIAEGTVVRLSKRAVAIVLEPREGGTRQAASEAEQDG